MKICRWITARPLPDNCPHEISAWTIIPGVLPSRQLPPKNSPLDNFNPRTIVPHEISPEQMPLNNFHSLLKIVFN